MSCIKIASIPKTQFYLGLYLKRLDVSLAESAWDWLINSLLLNIWHLITCGHMLEKNDCIMSYWTEDSAFLRTYYLLAGTWRDWKCLLSHLILDHARSSVQWLPGSLPAARVHWAPRAWCPALCPSAQKHGRLSHSMGKFAECELLRATFTAGWINKARSL